MTIERFKQAVNSTETVTLVDESTADTRTIRGTADWQLHDGNRYAAVRTADGKLHTGSWPAHSFIFSDTGLQVSRAVQYRNGRASVANLAKLTKIPDDKLVDALIDEVAEYRMEGGWIAIAKALSEAGRPNLGTQPRAAKAFDEAAKRKAADEAASREEAAKKEATIGAMTAIATGTATDDEANDIRRRIGANIHHAPDGTAKTIASKRFPELIELYSEASLERLKGLAAPLSRGRHMTAAKAVGVRWQESPDEADVSGVIRAARGRILSTEAAGRHNVRTIRRVRKTEAAQRRIDEVLSETIDEHKGVPTNSVEIVAAQNLSETGHGDRYYLTTNRQLVKKTTEYDWPTIIRISARPVNNTTITAGLKIKRQEIPATGGKTPE